MKRYPFLVQCLKPMAYANVAVGIAVSLFFADEAEFDYFALIGGLFVTAVVTAVLVTLVHIVERQDEIQKQQESTDELIQRMAELQQKQMSQWQDE